MEFTSPICGTQEEHENSDVNSFLNVAMEIQKNIFGIKEVIMAEENDGNCDTVNSDPLEDPLGNSEESDHYESRNSRLEIRRNTMDDETENEENVHCTDSPNTDCRDAFSNVGNESSKSHNCRSVFKCPHCDFNCNWPTQLKRHLLSHSPEKCKVYRCEHCNYTTNKASAMKLHNFKFMRAGSCKKGRPIHEMNELAQVKKEIDKSDDVGTSSGEMCSESNSFLNIPIKRENCDEDEVEDKTCRSTFLRCSSCSFKTRNKLKFAKHKLKHLSEKEISENVSNIKVERETNETGVIVNPNKELENSFNSNISDPETPFEDPSEFESCSDTQNRTVKPGIKLRSLGELIDNNISYITNEDNVIPQDEDNIYSSFNEDFVDSDGGMSFSNNDFSGFLPEESYYNSECNTYEEQFDPQLEDHCRVNYYGAPSLNEPVDSPYSDNNFVCIKQKKRKKSSSNVYGVRNISYSNSRVEEPDLGYSKENVYKCKMCTFKASEKDLMKNHVRICSKRSSKTYKCSKCPFETTYLLMFKKHTSLHKNEQSNEANKFTKDKYSSFCSEENGEIRPNSLGIVSSKFISENEPLVSETTLESPLKRIGKKTYEEEDVARTPSPMSISGNDVLSSSSVIKKRTYESFSPALISENNEFSSSVVKKIELKCKRDLTQKSVKCENSQRFGTDESPYKTESNFSKSEESFTRNADGRMKCERCNYSTTSQKHIKRHLTTHSSIKRFNCTLCDFVTNVKRTIINHFLRFHRTKISEKSIDLNDRFSFDKLIREFCIKNSHEFTVENEFKTSKVKLNVDESEKIVREKNDENREKENKFGNYSNAVYSSDMKSQTKSEIITPSVEKEGEDSPAVNKEGRSDSEICSEGNGKVNDESNNYLSMKISVEISNRNESNTKSSSDHQLDPEENTKRRQKQTLPCEKKNVKGKDFSKEESPLNKPTHLYSCKHCQFTSDCKNNLKRHFYLKHYSKKVYRCQFCEYSTNEETLLENHILKCSNFDREVSEYFEGDESLKNEVDSLGRKNDSKRRFEKVNTEYVSNEDNEDSFETGKEEEKESVETSSRQILFKCLGCNFSSKWTRSVRRHFLRKHPDVVTETQGNGMLKTYEKIECVTIQRKPLIHCTDESGEVNGRFNSGYVNLINNGFNKTESTHSSENSSEDEPELVQSFETIQFQDEKEIKNNSLLEESDQSKNSSNNLSLSDSPTKNKNLLTSPNLKKCQVDETKGTIDNDLEVSNVKESFEARSPLKVIVSKCKKGKLKKEHKLMKIVNKSSETVFKQSDDSDEKKNIDKGGKDNVQNGGSLSPKRSKDNIGGKEDRNDDDDDGEKLFPRSSKDSNEEEEENKNDNHDSSERLSPKSSKNINEEENRNGNADSGEKLSPLSSKNINSEEENRNDDTESSDCLSPKMSKLVSETRKCSFCEFRCTSNKIMTHHMRLHKRKDQSKNYSNNLSGDGNKRLLKCSLCDFKSRFQKRLVKHLKTHSEVSGLQVKSFHCSECNFETENKNKFYLHKKTHTEINSTEENTPASSSEDKVNLDKQLLQKRVFRCLDCNYFAVSKNSMESHIREQNHRSFIYECEKCTFISNNVSQFEEHRSTHTRKVESTIYKCLTCDFQTQWKVALRRHSEKLNHSALIYKCSICSFRGSSREELDTHRHCRRNKTEEGSSGSPKKSNSDRTSKLESEGKKVFLKRTKNSKRPRDEANNPEAKPKLIKSQYSNKLQSEILAAKSQKRKI